MNFKLANVHLISLIKLSAYLFFYTWDRTNLLDEFNNELKEDVQPG